jgi:hypothetical protein
VSLIDPIISRSVRRKNTPTPPFITRKQHHVNNQPSNNSATGFKYLTEDAIKRSAVKYLKGYYKFRERTGETVTNFDMVTESGAKADGLLTYPDANGKPFRATIEATSYDSRYEVLYVNQNKKLFIDAFTAALVGASTLFMSAWWTRLWIVAQYGLPKTVILIFCILALLYVFFNFLWQNESRYRYILALEQFKSYHADEQWVAIGEDVFLAPNDPKLLELKKQCIYNGFGLIVVSDHLEPQPWLTPAREEIFQRRRREQGFYKKNNSTFQKILSNNLFQIWGEKLKKGLSRLQFKGWGDFKEKMTNFSLPQLLLGVAMLLLLGSLLYKEYLKQTDITYVKDEAKYSEELRQEKLKRDSENNKKYGEEADGHWIDAGAARKYDQKDVPKPYETGNNKGIFADKDELVPKTSAASMPDMSEKGSADMYINMGYHTGVTYSCERLAHLKGKYYIVMESGWGSTNDAVARVEELKKLGVSEANYLWLRCFDASKKNYIVYVGGIDKEKKSADVLAHRFSAWLDTKGESTPIQVVTLERRK